jgi:hypothetical protein
VAEDVVERQAGFDRPCQVRMIVLGDRPRQGGQVCRWAGWPGLQGHMEEEQ